jgi:hypothetical protein
MDYLGWKIAYILQYDDLGYVSGEYHGLIAATEDQSTVAAWRTITNAFTNGSSSLPGGIRTGSANTTSIIS